MRATLTALRAQLSAADPLRPAVSRMPRAEVEFLLQHIAEGGALWTADDDQPALGAFRGFGMRKPSPEAAWLDRTFAHHAGLAEIDRQREAR